MGEVSYLFERRAPHTTSRRTSYSTGTTVHEKVNSYQLRRYVGMEQDGVSIATCSVAWR